MKIIEVNNTASAQEFLQGNVIINKDLPHYIQPLNSDINSVFDKQKNKNFSNGKAIRWVLKDGNNKLIGRIAAFINSNYKSKTTDFNVGGIGFFDCINNQQAANLLFDTAKNWLQQQGVDAMDGPINFGDRDKFWGCLVEGFDKPPIYGMPFNYPYYQQLFENYGFKNYYNQYWYAMSVNDEVPQKFIDRYERFKSKPDYTAQHLQLNQLQKFAKDFTTVYNTAWAQHGETKTITVDDTLKIFETLKPILDPKVIWFAYYKNEPIGMFINVPDINQYIKTFNGKLGWWQLIKLLWLKASLKNKNLMGLVFGVIPKYQNLGIDSLMIMELSKVTKNKGNYDRYEMGWAGEWNPRMHNVYKNLGATQSRRHVTYRYIFDSTKYLFERHPIMDYK